MNQLFQNAGAKTDEQPTQDTPGTPETPAEAPAEESASVEPVDEVIYSCHPLQRFKVHTYEFVRGVMKLPTAEAKKFDEFVKTLPPRERAVIKKIDVAAAQKLASQVKSNRVRGVDTAGVTK